MRNKSLAPNVTGKNYGTARAEITPRGVEEHESKSNGREHFEAQASLMLRVDEVAEMLSVSERSVWRLRSRGQLPASVRLGSSIRWRRAEILAWVGAGCPTIKNSG